MLKKFLFVVLLLLFVVSCSTPQERRKILEKVNLGKIIHQKHETCNGCYDEFIVLDEFMWLSIVKVTDKGEIYEVTNIKEIKCE